MILSTVAPLQKFDVAQNRRLSVPETEFHEFPECAKLSTKFDGKRVKVIHNSVAASSVCPKMQVREKTSSTHNSTDKIIEECECLESPELTRELSKEASSVLKFLNDTEVLLSFFSFLLVSKVDL